MLPPTNVRFWITRFQVVSRSPKAIGYTKLNLKAIYLEIEEITTISFTFNKYSTNVHEMSIRISQNFAYSKLGSANN